MSDLPHERWRIHVDSPRFWWRTTAANIRRTWVSTDPDEDDQSVRYPDHDQHRWPLIAASVAAVGDQLAVGAWTPYTDDEDAEPDRGVVTIPTSDRLTVTEREIVESWFAPGAAVMVDPWFEPLTNGRHRLWATLPHFKRRLVPITSEALQYADPVSAAAMGAGWHELYVDQVDQLLACSWFDTADALNSQFVSAMRAAAVGEFPTRAAVPTSGSGSRRRPSLWSRITRRV